MTAPLVLIAAGGTGGHMFPAQALAEEMLARGWRVSLSTDERGATHSGGFPDAVSRQVVPSATFSRGGIVAKALVPFRVLNGILSAITRLRRDRPSVVVGFGGYPSIPAMAASWLLGIPRMIHEQNGVLGRVNALFTRRVQRVACSLWPMELPAGVAGVHTGNPVRAAVKSLAGSPYPNIGTGSLRLLVFGGSQGAHILSDVVPKAISALPDELRMRLDVSQQARPEDISAVQQGYDDLSVPCTVKPFFEDIPDRLAAAHLVVSRAGASSVADITVIGRPSILVPLAIAVRDEQTANARPLVDAGAAVMLSERDFAPDVLSRHIAGILGAPDCAAEMAARARELGRPDAAERLAEEVLALKGQK